MKDIILQINKFPIIESFDSTNNMFEEFREFTSELFFQIMDIITTAFQSFVK